MMGSTSAREIRRLIFSSELEVTDGAASSPYKTLTIRFLFMTARRCYRFGPFRLSADGTMLLRDAAPVPLAPKALRTLLTLVERAGEVVTKQQLLETVSPDSFVEDTGLTRNISVIRQAFGEDGERFIATVARLGYRFTAPVMCIESSIKPPRPVPVVASRNDRGLHV